MQIIKKLVSLFAVTGAVIAATPAPVSAQGFDWSGVYVGAHAGAAWADIDWALSYPFGAPPASSTFSQEKFVWGGHVGIQHQFGNVVLGAELSSTTGLASSAITGVNLFGGARIGDLRTEIDQLVTATGRLGYARDRWLGYVKAGWAGAKVGVSTDDNVPPNFVSSVKARNDGYTLGAGVEYALTQNLILGLEYNYVDLGNDMRAPVTTRTGGIVAPNAFAVSEVDTTIHTIAARLSFKIGREAAAVAAPLK